MKKRSELRNRKRRSFLWKGSKIGRGGRPGMGIGVVMFMGIQRAEKGNKGEF